MSKPEAAIANLGASVAGKGKSAVEDDLFHVLLVGGDATTVSLNTRLFTRHSCKVSTAYGFQALAFLGLHTRTPSQPIPDMVVTDYYLRPGKGFTGFDLLEIIRELDTVPDLQVVILLPDEMLAKSHVFWSYGALTFKNPLTEEDVATLMNQQNQGGNGLVRGSLRDQKASLKKGKASRKKEKASRRKGCGDTDQRTESIMQSVLPDNDDNVAEETQAFQRLSLEDCSK